MVLHKVEVEVEDKDYKAEEQNSGEKQDVGHSRVVLEVDIAQAGDEVIVGVTEMMRYASVENVPQSVGHDLEFQVENLPTMITIRS